MFARLQSDANADTHAVDADEAEDLDSMDAVFTYVNDTDPAWRADFERHAAHFYRSATNRNRVHDDNANTNSRLPSNRFRDWGELRYSMRSALQHAGQWLRHFIVVVAYESQVPVWLDATHPRVRVVFHRELFDDARAQLPTFNSLAIETVLHRIRGLSAVFIYFNNDIFLGRRALRSTFITHDQYVQFAQWSITDHRSVASARCARALMNLRIGVASASTDPISQRQSQTRRPLEARPIGHAFDDAEIGPPPSLADRRLWQCGNHQFWLDRYLALRHWGVNIDKWFAHTPHVWQRRALRRVETVLGTHIRACRANRFRDPDIDVSMHLQYEALLDAEQRQLQYERDNGATVHVRRVVQLDLEASAADRGTESEQVPLSDTRDTTAALAAPRLLYHYCTFDSRAADSLQNTTEMEHRVGQVWASIERAFIAGRPLFFGVDDDLVSASVPLRSAHRRHFAAFMTRHWRIRAPWEKVNL